jgi:MipA family protein
MFKLLKTPNAKHMHAVKQRVLGFSTCISMLVCQTAFAQEAATEHAAGTESSKPAIPSMQDISKQIPQGFIVGGLAIYAEPRYDLDVSNSAVYPGFVYLGDRFYFLGDRARYTFARGEKVSLSVNARVRFGNLDPNDNPDFANLNERKTELEMGLGISAITPIGLLTGSWSADVSGHSKGQMANVSLYIPYYKNNFLLMPVLGVNWRSGAMSNYYFGGVSAQEASPSIAAYDTGSTISPNLMLTMAYRINEHWLIGGSAYYEHLDNNIARSPIVQGAEEMTYYLGAGYYWK